MYNPARPCQGTIGGPTIPSATLVKTFTINPQDPKSQYLSFIVMLAPSNDAFFATDSAHPIRLYDVNGRFNSGHGPIRLKISRRDIFDAGTEVNTESSGAFFGQAER